MNTKSILPAIVLGVASFGLSASVLAEKYTDTRPVGPVTGFFNATGHVINGIGHVTMGAVGGVVKGTGYVVRGVAHTTTGFVHSVTHQPTHAMNKPVHKTTHKVHHKSTHKMENKPTKA